MENKRARLLWTVLAGGCIALAPAWAWAGTEIYRDSCTLASGNQTSSVEMRQDQESHEIKLLVNGQAMPAFSDLGSAEYEVGEIVMSHCSDHAFVFVFNYGSPYLKGFAYRQCGQALRRLDFAEKLPPLALSRCSEPLFAVFQNEEAGGYKIVEAQRTRSVARIRKARIFLLDGNRRKP
jgi:hypothetical protein